jgi:uncharacterized phage protein (TIGR01671 family)
MDMRNIKFRAYVKFLNEIQNVTELYNTGGCMVDGYPYALAHDDVKLMEFTGLQDKNSVDIYEGDVLKQTYEDGDVFGVVKYVMAEAGYITEGINEMKDYPLCFNAYYSGKIEIVGNIHSNPELLEQ